MSNSEYIKQINRIYAKIERVGFVHIHVSMKRHLLLVDTLHLWSIA